ncbi:MAG: Mrp/NBP35 family ATP-binding protein [Fibrobacterales bacterium]
MAGQPVAEKQPIATLAKVKNRIGIASGKGGVGKSSVTANLAMALSLSGAKVGIMDADIYGPSQVLMFNLGDAKPEVIDGKLQPVETFGGIKVISMGMLVDPEKAVIWRGPKVHQMIEQFMKQVEWGELDYLLIDLPPGTGDVQLTLTQSGELTGALVVTTPQEVSVIDARKGIAMFNTVSVPVFGLIENMSYFVCDNCDKKHYIFPSGGGKSLSDQFSVPVLSELPMDPSIAQGADNGKPIVYAEPNSPTAAAFIELAGKVVNITG